MGPGGHGDSQPHILTLGKSFGLSEPQVHASLIEEVGLSNL